MWFEACPVNDPIPFWVLLVSLGNFEKTKAIKELVKGASASNQIVIEIKTRKQKVSSS